jgi:hypothetical protein
MAAKVSSPKQVALATVYTGVAAQLGLKTDNIAASTWVASGIIGRCKNPGKDQIAVLDVLKARPYYGRSSREAEWQAQCLKLLSEFRKNKNGEELAKGVAELFERRETA